MTDAVSVTDALHPSAPAVAPRATRRRLAPTWALTEATRLAPVLLLPAVAHWLDPFWVYTSPGHMDPWIYFGIAANFDLITANFGGSYYWTRFPWTLPGAVLYGLFDPLVAKHLWHFLFLYAAVLSVYGSLRVLGDYPTALVGAIVLSFDRFFLGSLGWDYVDGPAAVYVALTLYLLAVAAARGRASPLFIAAGFASGLPFNVQFSPVVLMPAFVVYTAVILRRRGEPRSWLPTLAIAVGLMAFGFGLALLAAMLVHWYYTGSFNYLDISLRVMRYVSDLNPNATPPLVERLMNRLPSTEGRWLQFPLLVGGLVAVAVVSAAVRKRRMPLVEAAAYAYYGASLVIWLLSELLGPSLSAFYYHFTAYYPGLYLAAAALIGSSLRDLAGPARTLGVAVMCAGAAVLVGSHPGPAAYELGGQVVLGYLVLALLWSIVEGARRRGTRATVWSAGLLVAIVVGCLYVRAENVSPSMGRGRTLDRDTYLAVAEAIQVVGAVFSGEAPYFFYRAGPPEGWVGHAISMTYIGRQLGNRLPELDCSVNRQIPPSLSLVVMTVEPAAQEPGLEALHACGLRTQHVTDHHIEQGSVSYHLSFYAAQREP